MTVTELDCRAYLLGHMTAPEAERLELRLLEDETLFRAMEGAEDDLFDAFARGQLSSADHSEFLERFGADPRRLAFARALASRVSTGRRSWWHAGFGLAAAAVLTLAVGGAWWLRSRPAPVASPASAPRIASAPAAVPVVALLTLSTSRAAGEPPVIAVPASAPGVELRVRLNPADRYERYSMELRSSADAVVWRGDDLRASSDGGDLVVRSTVPAALLSGGRYELAVRGGSADLGFLSVRITRTP